MFGLGNFFVTSKFLTGLLAKGYGVKRFDFLVQIEDKSFIPVDREAEFQSLDDADATNTTVVTILLSK